MTVWVRLYVVALVALSGAILASVPSFSEAAEMPTGVKSVFLISQQGQQKEIGKVEFSADGTAANFAVVLGSTVFTDEFLSMRPFRCISPPKRMWCHLPYPYSPKHRVTANDLTDLEYALMFLWRPYDKVGVDAWNGLYFKMALQSDGSIRGKLHEVDFNILAVPPSGAGDRLIAASDLTPTQPGQHAFDAIEIR